MPIKAQTTLKLLEVFNQSSYNRIEGRTRIQKILFLLQTVYDVNFSLDFISYHYGPYSFELKNLIQKCKELSLIREKTKRIGFYRRYDYILTEIGKKFLSKYYNLIDEKEKDNIKYGVMELESLSLDTLVITAKSIMSRT